MFAKPLSPVGPDSPQETETVIANTKKTNEELKAKAVALKQ